MVVIVPDRTLPTVEARQVLPDRVDRQDAAFNLGRMGLLLAGLADRRALVAEATEDRLHQGYRSALFPEAPGLLAALVDGGALAACWSGAGPSLLGFTTAADAPAVRVGGPGGDGRRPGARSGPRAPAGPRRSRDRRRGPPPTRRRRRVASPRLPAVTRKFLIRTFGCQMNEHDSERLAGLLAADGMEPTTDLDQADLVVLNTCCIRENADNRLYGTLGHLKSLRDAKPGLQIAVGGCLAQKDRELVRQKAGHVDVVFGTHNLARAPELLRRASVEGPIVEIMDAPDPTAPPDHAPALSAVRELPYAAWVTIQTGCDNSCAFCIVPAVRGAEVSRTPEDIVAEVESLARRGVVEVTLLGQNVNSYGRDLTKRRPLFADLLAAVGAVDGIRRVRFTSPHPKDLRPETIAAMAETSTPSASSSTCRCSPAATGCSQPCAGGTPPSGTSTGCGPPGPRCRTWR